MRLSDTSEHPSSMTGCTRWTLDLRFNRIAWNLPATQEVRDSTPEKRWLDCPPLRPRQDQSCMVEMMFHVKQDDGCRSASGVALSRPEDDAWSHRLKTRAVMRQDSGRLQSCPPNYWSATVFGALGDTVQSPWGHRCCQFGPAAAWVGTGGLQLVNSCPGGPERLAHVPISGLDPGGSSAGGPPVRLGPVKWKSLALGAGHGRHVQYRWLPSK